MRETYEAEVGGGVVMGPGLPSKCLDVKLWQPGDEVRVTVELLRRANPRGKG